MMESRRDNTSVRTVSTTIFHDYKYRLMNTFNIPVLILQYIWSPQSDTKQCSSVSYVSERKYKDLD